MYRRHGFCAVLLVVSSGTSTQAAFEATADFEGGSARFLSIDAERQSVVFVPGGERARGWPCWWWFQVDGIKPGSTVSVTLEGRAMQGISSTWAMPGQATFSMDGGKTWRQTPPGKRDGTRMTRGCDLKPHHFGQQPLHQPSFHVRRTLRIVEGAGAEPR